MQPETENVSNIGQELRAISTSHQWSLLTAVLSKLNKKLSQPVSEQQLCSFLKDSTEEELNKNGIWVQFFGTKYVPIICINPPLARTNGELGLDRPCKCKTKTQEKNYFGSFAYNAGRHESDTSSHIATCVKWRPPKAGHLHSWRRGYNEDKKKQK